MFKVPGAGCRVPGAGVEVSGLLFDRLRVKSLKFRVPVQSAGPVKSGDTIEI